MSDYEKQFYLVYEKLKKRYSEYLVNTLRDSLFYFYECTGKNAYDNFIEAHDSYHTNNYWPTRYCFVSPETKKDMLLKSNDCLIVKRDTPTSVFKLHGIEIRPDHSLKENQFYFLYDRT